MVAHWIHGWAQRTPNKTAIVFNGRPISYRAFAELIDLARGFFAPRDAVGPGVAVMAVNNRIDFWSISLALRSFGLTTIAVGSAQELADLNLKDVRLVVQMSVEAWPGLSDLCDANGWRLIPVPFNAFRDVQPLPFDPTTAVPAGHILRTSGTTGDFKKVLIDPSFEEAMMRERAAIIGLTQDSADHVFAFPPYTATGYKAPAAAWLVGATSIIFQDRRAHLALRIPGATHGLLSPGMLERVLAAPEGSFPRSETLQLALAGGSVGWTQVQAAKARITPRIFNLYTSTEGSRITYTAVETPEDYRWHRVATKRKVELVDEFDRPTPLGEVGRLRISTQNAPKGYLDDEETTRAFFRDGFFYPGDLAVMRADGRFALRGRVTDILNMRGLKISPAPAEEALKEGLGVSGVCLFSLADETGAETLHVIIESKTQAPEARLVAILAEQLPGFPSAKVHYLDSLPRNEAGKLLRQQAKAAALKRHAGR